MFRDYIKWIRRLLGRGSHVTAMANYSIFVHLKTTSLEPGQIESVELAAKFRSELKEKIKLLFPESEPRIDVDVRAGSVTLFIHLSLAVFALLGAYSLLKTVGEARETLEKAGNMAKDICVFTAQRVYRGDGSFVISQSVLLGLDNLNDDDRLKRLARLVSRSGILGSGLMDHVLSRSNLIVGLQMLLIVATVLLALAVTVGKKPIQHLLEALSLEHPAHEEVTPQVPATRPAE